MRVCYVVVQTGRIYFLDQEAIHHLAQRTPWYVVRIRGEEVVKVYRVFRRASRRSRRSSPGGK